ncbi:hypothetical protein EDC04DRAFT_2897936 [Pisolithus marmoratus]|nr:hypothetical protein EDC04DRAFT_2897936 [Pisolithus marmoratus]
MPALPPELPAGLQDNPDIASAYSKCLQLERSIQSKIDLGNDVEKQMIYVEYLATSSTIFRPATWITSFSRSSLPKLFLETYLSSPVKSNEVLTPSISVDTLSPPSCNNLTDTINSVLQEPPQNYKTAKSMSALVRDGFQCVVTKVYDNPPLWAICAHIFPESISANITSGSDLEMCAASVWAVLDCFGHHSLREELNGTNIHRLENVMTLDPTVHNDFATLKIWFTAMEPNQYRLEAVDNFYLYGCPASVTFSTPNPEKYPLPNPTYLAIRAACAKVAHLSGAGEYIEKVFRRMEDTRVLAEDGGSSELLHEALLSSMHVVSLS